MRKLKNISALLIMLLVTGSISAQNAKTEEVDIKVSSQCTMCKERIERTLAFEKGVIKSNLDLETHTVKVTYKNGKTTPEALRKAISDVGYDADDVAGDAKAYAKLPDCCKKEADRVDPHAGHNH